MKKQIKAHGTRRRMRIKGTFLLHDPEEISPYEMMALIRMAWEE